MKHISITLALLILASCSSNKIDDKKKSKASLFYSGGTQSLLNKDYSDALKRLKQANKLKPNDSKTLNNLGMTYYFKARPKIAIRYIKKSIEIDPKNSDAKNNLAGIYFALKKYNLATKLYKSILEDLEYKSQFRVQYNLALISLKKGQTFQAIEYLKSSLKEKNDYCPAHYQFGDIYFANGKFKQALKSYKKASVGTCISNVAPQYKQALTLLKMRDFSKARGKFKEVIENFPSDQYTKKAEQYLSRINNVPGRIETELDRTEHLYRPKTKSAKKIDGVNF